MNRQKFSARFRFFGALLLLAALIFVIPALKTGDHRLYLLAVAVPCAVFLAGTILARIFSLDRMLLAFSMCLCSMGIAALAPSDPDAALAQALRCAAGLGALMVGGALIRSLSSSLLTSVCTAFLGLLLLAGKLLAPSLTAPLAEIALSLLLLSFASTLTRQGPVAAVSVAFAALALLLIRGDLTEALFWGLTILFLLFAADGRVIIVLPSLAVTGLLFFGAVRLFQPIQAAQEPAVQSLLISVGAVGEETLPEGLQAMESFSLLVHLCGHYGLIFTALILLLFLPLTLRGTFVASCSRTRFHAVLAMGVSLLLALKVLVSILTFFSFLPFSPSAVPLLTSSLTDLCAQFFLIGIVCGISGRNEADLAEDAHLAMLAK